MQSPNRKQIVESLMRWYANTFENLANQVTIYSSDFKESTNKEPFTITPCKPDAWGNSDFNM